ncbi:hypothetical protein ANFP_22850 [Acidithiobacillus ferrooxidans]|nr:hypothetical protein ANFP_22850 [Acidithiobacillus ferrooxidans]
MEITAYGLDLAKSVMQLHWVDMETGEIHRKQLKRRRLLEFFANRQPGVVAMEACGSAQEKARERVLRDTLMLLIRQKRDAHLEQIIESVWRVPGFSGIRDQVKKLAKLLHQEWKRSRGQEEAMPAIPERIRYLRRLPSLGRASPGNGRCGKRKWPRRSVGDERFTWAYFGRSAQIHAASTAAMPVFAGFVMVGPED